MFDDPPPQGIITYPSSWLSHSKVYTASPFEVSLQQKTTLRFALTRDHFATSVQRSRLRGLLELFRVCFELLQQQNGLLSSQKTVWKPTSAALAIERMFITVQEQDSFVQEQGSFEIPWLWN